MSPESSPVSAALMAYIADHTWPEPVELTRLRAQAEEAGLPPISVGPAQARLLQVLLGLARARTVVEVGTLGGYSALAMAEALPEGGLLHTIECEPQHADFAEARFAESEQSSKLRLHRGPAGQVLPRFDEASVDAVFVDADKENYPLYLDEALRILVPGGLFLADNAFAFGRLLDPNDTDPDVAAIRSFNDLVANHPRLQGQILGVGDGMWLALKRA